MLNAVSIKHFAMFLCNFIQEFVCPGIYLGTDLGKLTQLLIRPLIFSCQSQARTLTLCAFDRQMICQVPQSCREAQRVLNKQRCIFIIIFTTQLMVPPQISPCQPNERTVICIRQVADWSSNQYRMLCIAIPLRYKADRQRKIARVLLRYLHGVTCAATADIYLTAQVRT